MLFRKICFVISIIAGIPCFAQLHAHNDYEKPKPFTNAYENGFGSIEVDIFLKDGKLLVAHDTSQFRNDRTISSLYLDPVDSLIKKGGNRQLQLMIDIKTEAVSSLNALIEKLKEYPSITGSDNISIVISGNRPAPEKFKDYPSYILFDGLLQLNYSSEALKRVPMFSDNFKNYSKWNGNGALPEADKKRIVSAIKKAHQLGKMIRFWNAPDNVNAWRQLMRLNADWINTDHVKESAQFIQALNSSDSATGNPSN